MGRLLETVLSPEVLSTGGYDGYASVEDRLTEGVTGRFPDIVLSAGGEYVGDEETSDEGVIGKLPDTVLSLGG